MPLRRVGFVGDVHAEDERLALAHGLGDDDMAALLPWESGSSIRDNIALGCILVIRTFLFGEDLSIREIEPTPFFAPELETPETKR